MTTSIIKKEIFAISKLYYDYFVTDRHPAINFIMSSLSWIIWAVILIGFFGLLYFGHYIIWLSIVAILAIIEIAYYIKK